VTSALDVLADPTRRSIFERLADGPQAVGDLAQHFPVSRPAVSQHLRALKVAGLVRDRAEGRRRVYAVDPKGVEEMRCWLDRFWDRALVAYAAATEEEEKET
jgi:DNA-binding transcriptional ArsR family regulator